MGMTQVLNGLWEAMTGDKKCGPYKKYMYSPEKQCQMGWYVHLQQDRISTEANQNVPV